MSIYLRSLEISGFKSFGTRTYIEFSEGITGIVGPNGCGKSNVVESMKWVLGEQSAKTLRGEKMQDIIFAGTKHRSASGMADVTLTFNNELQWLPLEFPEVSVGRRIFRSGEGQYFINNARTRLKDTTELFLDTGVGRSSYAIFEQGKIDRLLSESAEDRRILFEDFAGISKFKFRKEEAEKKLLLARENLDRIQETLDRLEKEISILEYQAQDAENYNIINNELRELEIKFEVARIHNMSNEILQRENEILKLKNTLKPMTEKLNGMENQISFSDETLGEKEKLFGELNNKYIKLEKELSETKIHYQSAQKNFNDQKNRLQELTIRSKHNQERLEEWKDIIIEKQDALYEAEKIHSRSTATLKNAESKQELLKDQITELEKELIKRSLDLGFNELLNRDDIDKLRTKISELQGQGFIQESEILRLEEEINIRKNSIINDNSKFIELKNSLDQILIQKEEMTTNKKSIELEINRIEQQILELEKKQNILLESSRSCDQEILNALDLQVENLKIFNQGQSKRQENLTNMLVKFQDIVINNNILNQQLLDELNIILKTQDEAYQFLLDKIFGENGSFSQKITIAYQLDLINKQINTNREHLESTRKEYYIINEQEKMSFQELTKIETSYKSYEKEIHKTEKNISQAQDKRSNINNSFQITKINIENTTLLLNNVEKAVKSYENALLDLRKDNLSLQEDLKNAHIQFHSTETQTKALERDINSLQDRLSDGQKQLQNIEQDKSNLTKSLKDLEEEIEDYLIEQDELIPHLVTLQDEIKNNTDEITNIRQSKKILEQLHKDSIEQFTKLRMRESEIEGSLTDRRITLENMKNSLFDQFHMTYDKIDLSEEENIEYLNNLIRKYRDRLNQLGNVNLLAIEQFQNTKDEYTHILFQKEDIEKATNDTESLINKTNQESAEKFVTAFNKIRQSFKILFSELFDGGEADLILTDKENPLKSGINIMAEPPGQKFQSVSLLSGGQRAMVAIAVIFSILELKPTPFVILDEMDAPLDDENIDRFKRLLKRFRGISQFVVVSHSKSTLEVCDILFGVTMEELGCSKIVSVAFDETENLLFVQ